MAYRKMEMQVPSFLDEFLDQIQTLPAQVKAKFAEMRELDDRAAALMNEAQRNASEAVKRSATKSTGGNDPLKKAFQDMLSCHGKAADCAARKIELAEQSYQVIKDTVESLNETLREYEVQLKKEGRWPSTEKSETPTAKKAVSQRTSSITLTHTPEVPKTPAASREQASVVASSSGTTKSRKRDREREKVSTKFAEKNAASTSITPRSTKTEPTIVMSTSPDKMEVVEDMPPDPDEPRYCLCDRVSFGEMIACEGKNCAHEWFHYECVGLTSAPRGSWYCPECRSKRRKRN